MNRAPAVSAPLDNFHCSVKHRTHSFRLNEFSLLATRLCSQGQRTLSFLSRKDLHQEVDAPSRHAALHDVTLFAGMLFDQTQCHAT